MGQYCIIFMRGVGRFFSFVFHIFLACFGSSFYGKQWAKSLWSMLFCAIPLVSLASFCTGMVMAFQTGDGFLRFGIGEDFALPEVVSLSMVRELAPVLTGLMMAGRWSASITSDLAFMRMTSQIDALLTLSVNPIRYLAVPKVLSSVIAMPILVFVSAISGIGGGFIVATDSFPSLSHAYLQRSLDILQAADMMMCFQKAVVFGLLTVLIAVYNGWNVAGGSQGVGVFTTRSVVYSGLCVLILNFFATSFLV